MYIRELSASSYKMDVCVVWRLTCYRNNILVLLQLVLGWLGYASFTKQWLCRYDLQSKGSQVSSRAEGTVYCGFNRGRVWHNLMMQHRLPLWITHTHQQPTQGRGGADFFFFFAKRRLFKTLISNTPDWWARYEYLETKTKCLRFYFDMFILKNVFLPLLLFVVLTKLLAGWLVGCIWGLSTPMGYLMRNPVYSYTICK